MSQETQNTPLDSSNKFVVCVSGEQIAFCGSAVPRWLSREDAINLAAWLAVLADPGREKFNAMVTAIENS